MNLFASFITIALLALLPNAASQKAEELTLDVRLWSTRECCGSSIGYTAIKLGECVRIDADLTKYGRGIKLDGLWTNAGQTGLGYGIGWTSDNCTPSGPSKDIWYPACVELKGGEAPRSISWKAKNYSIFDPWVPDPKREIAIADVDGRQYCRGADWFEYFDADLGRSRKVEVRQSEEALQNVLMLHVQGDLESLRSYDETRKCSKAFGIIIANHPILLTQCETRTGWDANHEGNGPV
ncbi:hypothetical protein NMY22_g3006 [Coprinellus aureogranulatus]|nr:hypothetical protein NMY22_g3006 [Coprinellus aureogranulatus]